MSVITLGALLIVISLTTTDNTTQTGESMTVAENENNKLSMEAAPVAGVALVQYDILNGTMIPDIVLANNDGVLTTTSYEDDEEETKEVSEEKQDVDEYELYMLSHLIYAEAGSERLSDESRYYVGSVVLNRVKSKYFKQNTIEGIIFAEGQYECTWLGTYYNEPSEKCVEIARDLLENGSVLPENVVFQAEFKQGDGVYAHIDNIYFCYKN
jgi:hypothetical protein